MHESVGYPLTISISLVRVGYLETVIKLIRDAVLVAIRVTHVTESIAVDVYLVTVWHHGARVQVVLDTVMVSVDIGVTSITNTILVSITL